MYLLLGCFINGDGVLFVYRFWLFKFLAFVGPMIGGFWLPWDKMAEGALLIIVYTSYVIVLYIYSWLLACIWGSTASTKLLTLAM